VFIILVTSSESPEALRNISGLARSVAGRGHRVTVFFNGDSVRHLKAEGGDEALSNLGVPLLACRTSARENGITALRQMVSGAELSSLGELVDLMGDADRVLHVG